MPSQLQKFQAFPEMPSHFRKCVISAIACDKYMSNKSVFSKLKLIFSFGNHVFTTKI